MATNQTIIENMGVAGEIIHDIEKAIIDRIYTEVIILLMATYMASRVHVVRADRVRKRFRRHRRIVVRVEPAADNNDERNVPEQMDVTLNSVFKRVSIAFKKYWPDLAFIICPLLVVFFLNWCKRFVVIEDEDEDEDEDDDTL